MRKIVCEEFGPPSNLRIAEVDEPEPGPNEVLIRVEATGIGYVDALMAAGLYQIRPKVPYTPGNEFAGVVERAGDEVKHLRTGDRVLSSGGQGGLAEKVVQSETNCYPIPDVMSFEAAASFMTNYCTAYHGLIELGEVREGEVVLILGASGGVGAAAIDVAKASGAHVIAAASTKKKRDACLEGGADEVLNYNRSGWRDDLKKMLGERPLNIVYDPVGGDFAEPALRTLSPDGRFLVVGFAAGDIPSIPLNLTLLKRISVIGVNWGGYIAGNPSGRRPVQNQLLEWIAEGRLKPTAGEVFTLKRTGAAMQKMLDRKAIGKVVISNQK